MAWVYLAIAIFGEVVGTTALKLSNGFTNTWYTGMAILSYIVAFFFLSLVLRSIPIGVAYAIWAGVGVAAVALIGVYLFGQKLDVAAVLGITMIVAGVVVLQTLSTTTSGS